MYDIFYISHLNKIDNYLWQKFKFQYPAAKYAVSFEYAQKIFK